MKLVPGPRGSGICFFVAVCKGARGRRSIWTRTFAWSCSTMAPGYMDGPSRPGLLTVEGSLEKALETVTGAGPPCAWPGALTPACTRGGRW